MKTKIIIVMSILLSSFSALADECWKAVDWDFNEAILIEQDCSVTDPGYQWVYHEDISQWHGLSVDNTHVLLDPNVLKGFAAPLLRYMGQDSNMIPEIVIDFILPTDPVTGSVPEYVNPTAPLAATTYWTNWLDRDNQSGSGDYEHIAGFSGSQVCEFPVLIEARVKGTSTIFTQVTQIPEVLQHFSSKVGLVCKNSDQNDGMCMDYEVRFECQTGTWSNWLNRDNEFGSGDWEYRTGHALNCSQPINIKARVVGTTKIIHDQSDTIDLLHRFNPTDGLVCRNQDQAGTCQNYEVTFLCP